MRTVHVFTVFALLTGLTPVLAQQPAASLPDQVASAAKPPPPPPMINRWVDAHGQVHYGDTLPADAPEQTTEVGPLQSTTPEQKARAETQLQQYRSYLEQSPAAPQTAQTAASQAAAADSQQASSDNSCAEQWARFNAAAACASSYHVVGGGLRPNNCPVVPQPQCSPPGP